MIGEPSTRIRLPRLHPGQQSVLKHPARIKWLCAGRRWRKTSMLMVRVVREVMQRPRVKILWTAPTFKQAEPGGKSCIRQPAQ